MGAVDRVRERQRLVDTYGAASDEVASFDEQRHAARSDGTTPKYVRDHLRGQARRQESGDRTAYNAGVAAARSRKRRKGAPRPVRKAVQQLERPVEAQIVSGLKVIGLALGVVALYHALQVAEEAPDAVAGALQAPARALAWLSSPERSIPYGS